MVYDDEEFPEMASPRTGTGTRFDEAQVHRREYKRMEREQKRRARARAFGVMLRWPLLAFIGGLGLGIGFTVGTALVLNWS